MAVTAHTSVARTVSLSAAAVAASVAIPFLVHLAPGGSSIGATLLPIFWAPLLAVILFGAAPAVAAALLAPALNHLLTGMPPSFVVASLTVELAIFVTVLILGFNRAAFKRSSLVLPALLAPLAYLIARIATGALFVVLGTSSSTIAAVFTGLGAAVPGVISLFVMGLVGLLLAGRNRSA